MQHFSSLEGLSISKCWLTIGSFDGVHRGHQELIRDMVERAHQAGAKAGVLTFYPHPALVLRGQHGPYYLTSPDEQAQLLAELNIDVLITLPFNSELASQTAEEFFNLLLEKIELRELWVGRDFALGKDRLGDYEMLNSLGQQRGFMVKRIPAVIDGGKDISSSSIRERIFAGDVVEAALQLGRWYFVNGIIVHGEGRGHHLGFPTANLAIPPDRILPAIGVYGCLATIDGGKYKAVANIGVRPTFQTGQNQLRLEVHLLDFSRDVYGRSMKVEFISRLRDEIRFDRVEDLIHQVNQDIQTTRGIFTHGNRTPDLPA